MKIIILSQWFYPEPDLKGLPFARELVRNGHEVQVLTGFPNYPEGRIYNGYKIRAFQREIIDGINILRVPLYPNHDQSAFKRVLNYLSFAVSASILGTLLLRKADVMYVYHPPATSAIPAIVIKLLRHIPIVYDIQDLWPDTLVATGMFSSRQGIKLVDSYCRLCYKMFSKIVVLSPGFKNKLIDRNVPADKISVIYNWANDIRFPDKSVESLKSEFGFDEKFTVLFAGTMGKAQALESVIWAAKRVSEIRKDIQFAFIGGGIEVPELKKLTVSLNLGNVKFIDRVPPSNIGGLLKAADILLVHLKRDPLFDITIPSKTQAYLMAGKPILMCVDGDASEIIHRSGAGKCCEAENPDMIARRVIEFYKMSKQDLMQMGKNAKKFYDGNLSIEIGTKELLEKFNEVIFN